MLGAEPKTTARAGSTLVVHAANLGNRYGFADCPTKAEPTRNGYAVGRFCFARKAEVSLDNCRFTRT